MLRADRRPALHQRVARGSAGEGEDSTAYFDDTEDVGATLAEIEADERQRSKDFIDDTPLESDPDTESDSEYQALLHKIAAMKKQKKMKKKKQAESASKRKGSRSRSGTPRPSKKRKGSSEVQARADASSQRSYGAAESSTGTVEGVDISLLGPNTTEARHELLKVPERMNPSHDDMPRACKSIHMHCICIPLQYFKQHRCRFIFAGSDNR